MKNKIITLSVAVAMLFAAHHAAAQTSWNDAFNKFKLEARADADYTRRTLTVGDSSLGDPGHLYGIHGRYFNLMVGGNLGNGFSYYFRQRLKAESGSINFFDNTDFLWVNYQLDDHWRFRFGKDAMAVGGYEYDAPPIDEYIVSEYWNNFYCFQLGISAAYTTSDQRQTFVAQLTQSPYVNSLRDRGEDVDWNSGLLTYNVEWMGSIGSHIHTLWSTSMIERRAGHFMNLTMLGTQYTSGNSTVYLDLMHHALSWSDWGKNLGVVCRWDYRLSPQWSLFIKGSYEQNRSDEDLDSSEEIDHLVRAGHSYWKYGAGCEFRPTEAVRIHAYLAEMADSYTDPADNDHVSRSLGVNLGATWTMDFHKLFKK